MAILNRGMAGAPQALQMAYMRDPRMRLAQQLQAGATDTSPVGHWSQGLARLAQALAGNRLEDRADAEYRGQAEAYQNDMRGFMAPVMEQGTAGPGPRQGPGGATMRPATFAELSERAGRFQSPYAMEAARPLVQAAMQQDAERAKFDRDLSARREDATAQREFLAAQAREGMAFRAQESDAARRQAAALADLTRRTTLDAAQLRAGNKPEQSGPFTGNAMDAQDMNILLNPNADPNSPIYAAAYLRQYGARQYRNPDGTVTEMTPPAPPNIRAPVFGGPAVSAQDPTPPAQAPASPTAPTVEPVRTPSGALVTSIGAPRMSQNDRAKLDQSVTDAAVLTNSLNDYVRAFETAGPGERTKSALGVNTPLNTAFSNAALMAKGEALFNLGVLNGPDLDIIRRTLPDPSTIRGQASGVEGAKAAAQSIERLIQDRISSFYRQKGLEPPNMREYAAQLRANTPTPPLGGGAVADPALPPGFKVIQ